jgi:hypothetical protein
MILPEWFERPLHCPICGRGFINDQARMQHMIGSRRHKSIIDYLWELQFLLANAEEDKKMYREQLERN